VEKIEDSEIKDNLKCVIFDLSIEKHETGSSDFAIDLFIKDQFNNNRIPIFIHSAYIDSYIGFDSMGTVFKIPKASNSPKLIHEKIKLMKESGFLNVFCFNGDLDKKIMNEIHTAFIEQFKHNEIEEIIKSIKSNSQADCSKRTVEVFERLAIRSVYQNWMSAKSVDGESIEEIKVNAIEHYYRRNNPFDFWTGDIFKEKINGQKSVILTPRCNIGHGKYEELLLCKVNEITEDGLKLFLNQKIENGAGETKGQRSLRLSITDAPNNPFPGERFRFLPPTPQFSGGFVDFTTIYTLKNDIVKDSFEYVISLIDDLTNDVVRKLGAYLLRGGISETEYKESHYYLSNIER